MDGYWPNCARACSEISRGSTKQRIRFHASETFTRGMWTGKKQRMDERNEPIVLFFLCCAVINRAHTHTYWPSTDFRINSADKKNSFESGRVGAKRKKIENLDERGVEIDIPWVDHRVTSFFHVYRILAYEKGITIYRAFRGADILGCTDRYLNSNYTRHRQTCCYHFSNLKFRSFAFSPRNFSLERRAEYLTYGFRYASDSRREDGSG